MANWPVYGEITGPIVMIGFGSIGKGTLPLIERHFKYDKSRFVVIDPEDKDRHLCDERGVRFIKQAVTTRQLQGTARQAADRRRRPGLLRQRLGRHRLGRHHEFVPRGRRVLRRHGHRAVGRLLFRQQARARGAIELRLARAAARDQARQTGRHHGHFLLRREPGHGVLVRQAGAGQRRQGHRPQIHRAEEPRGMGQARHGARRQRHSHRRARHPAREISKAARSVRQHLVGGRLRLGRPAAGRAWLGHA